MQMKDFMQEYIKTTSGNEEKLVSDAEVKCVSSSSHVPRVALRWQAQSGLTSPFLRALRRYVMSIADSLGDGEVEEEEMTRAVATWKALLTDQEMIACETNRPTAEVCTLACSDIVHTRSRSTVRCL